MCRVSTSSRGPKTFAGVLARASRFAAVVSLCLLAGQALAGPRSAPAKTGAAGPAHEAVNGAIAAAAANPLDLPGQKLAARASDIGLRTNTAVESVVLGARAASVGETSTLTLDLSAPANVTAFVLAAPDRIIVDLPDTKFHVSEDAGRLAQPEGLIKSFRFGQFAVGRSRLVIDLAGPARIVKTSSSPLEGVNATRLVIALARETPANFAAAAAHAAALEASAPRLLRVPAVKSTASAKPVIVIDAGHGGIDSGAAGQAGTVSVSEKTVVFDFVRTLAQKLEATKRYKVTLTRDSDIFVPLDERVRIAREAHASLFISVHADTLSDSGDVSGATVYTVAERASDTESARIAEKENGADIVGGVSIKEDQSDVSDILFDLTRRETRAYSHVFAHQLTGAWASAARLNKNPERAAGFRVLRAPDVPSVLLELGFLSNDRDARSLISPDWRERASASVIRAIDQFFAPRLAAEDESGLQVDAAPTGSIGLAVPEAPQPSEN